MKQRFGQILPKFIGQTFTVWGDLILDQYIYTSTTRVSREAPVLVAEYERERFRLGGAGNVVMNLLTLGAKPLPVGLVGDDAQGRLILDLLRIQGVETKYLVCAANYRTPQKTRILAGGENTRRQQVLRIDTILRDEITAADCGKLARHLQRATDRSRGVIISDYLNHAVQPALLASLKRRRHDLVVAADSRENLVSLPGVTVATPNEPELRRIFFERKFTTDKEFFKAGTDLLDKLGAQGLVLKRGHKGMIVFTPGKKPEPIAIFGTTQIVDETGAGDTVLAVISLALGAGAGLADAARLASIAAGMVVMKEGAYPIPLRELRDALQ